MKLRSLLFPHRYCELPEAKSGDIIKDVIHTNSKVSVSFMDRLRVLVTGRVAITAKTVMVDGGAAYTNLTFEPHPPSFLADSDECREWQMLNARQKGAV